TYSEMTGTRGALQNRDRSNLCLSRISGAPLRSASRCTASGTRVDRRMTRKQRRLSLIGAALGVLALAVALVLIALKDSIVFFNSPTDVVEKQIKPGTPIRVGGLVKHG